MSSDYLNYELSKELHDLGVVFETKLWHMAYRDGTVELTDYATPLYYKEEWVGSFPAPSTARLIDEIQSRCSIQIRRCRTEHTIQGKYAYEIRDLSNDNYWSGRPLAEDRDATTALGKALIALVKEGK